MGDEQAQLRRFYETEARENRRRSPKGLRVDLRDDFIDRLVSEGCGTLLDFGAGPGLDVRTFAGAGFDCVGLDLAIGNAVLGTREGLSIVPGSIVAPPFKDASFDAGWSMSTLMHLADDAAVDAVTAMARVLRNGAPLMVGLWGSEAGRHVIETDAHGNPRPFHHRSPDRNRQILAAAGSIEHAQVLDLDRDGWQYQVFRVRVGHNLVPGTRSNTPGVRA
ncbi:MAG: class I SAM-dependent methyltransferase [Actinomycetia bacterium]|nr:class I SAM-dependent methyltransferase [Actinomycetes bacterium]